MLIAIVSQLLFSTAIAIDFVTRVGGGGTGFLYSKAADNHSAAVQGPASAVYADTNPASDKPGKPETQMADSSKSAGTATPVLDNDTDFGARNYYKYDVIMDAANISTAEFKRIVFYLRRQGIIKTNNWKLYIFRAKIKIWSEEEIDRWALKILEGRGVPPLNIVWDGISRDGKLLPAGKYYYVLTAIDADGRSYATKWHNFRLE